MKRLFQLYDNPILSFIVNKIVLNIPALANRNNGRFQAGDKVKYNWMAKVVLGDFIVCAYPEPMIVSHYETWSSNQENVCFTNEHGCSVFWLTRA